MRRLLPFLTVLLLAAPAAATNYTPQISGMIDGFVRPATARFAETAAGLPDAVAAVCSEGPDAAGARFREAYGATVTAYAAVNFLRFGPLADEDRLSRLAFLPDPRGITQRQLRKLMAARDEGALTEAGLADKSVALQGLTALELIAFSKETELELGADGPDKDFTCGYAAAIAQNVATIAEEVAEGWRDPDGYSAVLLDAGGENARFQTSKEALENLFNTLVTGLIIARDQDVLPALGAREDKASPRRFPFSRSGNAVDYLASEIEGLHAAQKSLGLEPLTPSDFSWIAGGLDFEFGNAQALLAQLSPPLRESFGDDGSYQKVAVLAITLKSIRDTMANELAGALNLAGGFNALDGD